MKLQSPPTSISNLSQALTAPDLKAQAERLSSVAILDKPDAVLADTKATAQGKVKKCSSRAVFSSTFLTIFLAEFGDKTQLSTLLMSAESESPWVVFLGAATALVTTSLLGVLLGQWLANRLAPRTLNKAAGVSLLLISVMLFWDVVRF